MRSSDITKQFKYRVALSFAGKDREFAKNVADNLRNKGIKVFYDHYSQHELWGTNLFEKFRSIYTRECRYCIMIITEDYLSQMWPIYERQQIIERLAKEHGQDSVLPVRIDGFKKEVPGLTDGIGYLSVSSNDYMIVVDNFLRKIMREGYDIDSTVAYTKAIQNLDLRKRGYIFFDRIYTSIDAVEKSFSSLISSDILNFMGHRFYWSKSSRDEPLLLLAENKISTETKEKGLVEICRIDAPEVWVGCGVWTIFWTESDAENNNNSLLIGLYIFSTNSSDLRILKNEDSEDRIDCSFLSALFLGNDNAQIFYGLAEKRYEDIR